VWVDVEGGALYVESGGAGSPLLMVHGWPLDHRLFEPQAEKLGRSHRVVTFDRRGFGASSAPPDLGREVDDIVAIIDALALDSVHLLGMSQGARIALRFAATRPDLLRSLLLQAPAIDGFAPGTPDPERIPLDEFVRLAREGRIGEVRKRWLAHPMMMLDGKLAHERARLDAMMEGYEGADLLADPKRATPFTVDVSAALRRFRAPCLLLTGARETAARRAHARRLLDLLPDCREVIFPASGHLSNLSEPRSYNRYVAEFCALADANDRVGPR
jgi:pimeloyl-ACP methyl ester carboxylesterase